MPVNGGELVVRYGNIDYHAYVGGNNTDFPEILNWPVAEAATSPSATKTPPPRSR